MPAHSAPGSSAHRLIDLSRRLRISSIKFGPATVTILPSANTVGAHGAVVGKLKSTKGRPTDLLALSAHNVDEVTLVDSIRADHECEAQGPTQRAPGGSGANTGFALGVLGASVELAGSVGDDSYGQMLLDSLASADVGVRFTAQVDGRTSGRTQNIVDRRGRRLLVVHPNANDHFAESADESALRDAALSSRVLHLSSFVDRKSQEMQTRLAAAVSSTTTVSLAPGAIYARQGLDRLSGLLEHTDILFLYRDQLATLVNESSQGPVDHDAPFQTLLDGYFGWKRRAGLHHPQILVVKDPDQNEDRQVREQYLAAAAGTDEAEQVLTHASGSRDQPDLVDTTGAGDAAAAGFLLGLLHGASMVDCLDSAFLLACFASTSVGARTAFVEHQHEYAAPRRLPNTATDGPA